MRSAPRSFSLAISRSSANEYLVPFCVSLGQRGGGTDTTGSARHSYSGSFSYLSWGPRKMTGWQVSQWLDRAEMRREGESKLTDMLRQNPGAYWEWVMAVG